MLELRNLSAYYGAICAIKNVSMTVRSKQIVTLIGANGAGKSTTVRTISKQLKPRGGSIFLNGENITDLSAREIVRLGVVQCPEGRHVFPTLTVHENLRLGAYLRTSEEFQESMDRVISLFPRLGEREKQLAGTLSGGEQQMLAIGRALMSRPKLLMLDEPSLGLAPVLVEEIFETIRKLNSNEGMTILLIEQNANMALSIADYAYVLELGTIALEGTGCQLLSDSRVRELYLGKEIE